MRLFSFTFLTLLLSFNIAAKQSIVLAVENSWPPYADNRGDGISKTIIQQAYAAVGVNVSFKTVPYARALKMAEQGLADGAFNVTKQQSTIEKFNFGQQYILQAKASYFYPKQSQLDFHSPADIPTGTSIALIIDYEYGEEFDKHKSRFKEIRVSSQAQIFKLLQFNRVDMAIMFDEVANYTIEKYDFNREEVNKGQVNHISNIYVAFSKKKNTKEAMDLLDKGLLKIRAANLLTQ